MGSLLEIPILGVKTIFQCLSSLYSRFVKRMWSLGHCLQVGFCLICLPSASGLQVRTDKTHGTTLHLFASRLTLASFPTVGDWAAWWVFTESWRHFTCWYCDIWNWESNYELLEHVVTITLNFIINCSVKSLSVTCVTNCTWNDTTALHCLFQIYKNFANAALTEVRIEDVDVNEAIIKAIDIDTVVHSPKIF